MAGIRAGAEDSLIPLAVLRLSNLKKLRLTGMGVGVL